MKIIWSEMSSLWKGIGKKVEIKTQNFERNFFVNVNNQSNANQSDENQDKSRSINVRQMQSKS